MPCCTNVSPALSSTLTFWGSYSQFFDSNHFPCFQTFWKEIDNLPHSRYIRRWYIISSTSSLSSTRKTLPLSTTFKCYINNQHICIVYEKALNRLFPHRLPESWSLAHPIFDSLVPLHQGVSENKISFCIFHTDWFFTGFVIISLNRGLTFLRPLLPTLATHPLPFVPSIIQIEVPLENLRIIFSGNAEMTHFN